MAARIAKLSSAPDSVRHGVQKRGRKKRKTQFARMGTFENDTRGESRMELILNDYNGPKHSTAENAYRIIDLFAL